VVNPIYRTLTGGIECTMEGGKLFVREFNEEKSRFNRGPWVENPISKDEAYASWRNAAIDIERFRLGCMYHCLTSETKSGWLIEYRSQELRRKIDALTVEYEQALADEMVDRPKIEGQP